jgi:hypothetical protein
MREKTDLILRSDPGLEPGERLEGCFETALRASSA